MATLYGIGVGPGAPDLLTLRAARILGRMEVILAAASSGNDYSLALRIASPHLQPDATIIRLNFPMTKDSESLANAWRTAAHETAAVLLSGKDAAFITLGDPLIYSTFAYLQRAVRPLVPGCQMEVVPGITSFQATAARLGRSICEGSEPFTLIPGILPEEELIRLLQNPGSAAILKVYRNYESIKRALRVTGRESASLMATSVEQGQERISGELEGGRPPYMTLIFSPGRQGNGGK